MRSYEVCPQREPTIKNTQVRCFLMFRSIRIELTWYACNQNTRDRLLTGKTLGHSQSFNRFILFPNGDGPIVIFVLVRKNTQQEVVDSFSVYQITRESSRVSFCFVHMRSHLTYNRGWTFHGSLSLKDFRSAFLYEHTMGQSLIKKKPNHSSSFLWLPIWRIRFSDHRWSALCCGRDRNQPLSHELTAG